jgi:hypothetical protein
MSEQDQKALYTAFTLLGLLTRGHPLNHVAEAATHIVDIVMARQADENDSH